MVQVKHDQWVPLVSVRVLVRVADVWTQSTAMSAWSKMTRGATEIKLNLSPVVN